MPPARPFARPLLLAFLLTLAISLLRLWGEVAGWATNASGGRFLPLGITWLVFVCGAWFGRRLADDGHPPRTRRAWLWSLLALLTMLGVAIRGFAPLAKAEPNDATFALLRAAVLRAIAVAGIAGAAMRSQSDCTYAICSSTGRSSKPGGGVRTWSAMTGS